MADATVTVVDGKAVAQPFGSELLTPLVLAASGHANAAQGYANTAAASASAAANSAFNASASAAAARNSAEIADNAASAVQGGVERFFATVADGVAGTAVGQFFASAETGTTRLYLRTATPPYYEDLGEGAAPLTRTSLFAADVTAKLKSALSDGVPFAQIRRAVLSVGALGSPIFANGELAPQGMTRFRLGSTSYYAMLQRVAGTSYMADERQRWVVYEVGAGDGGTLSAAGYSAPLALGHQGAGAYVEGGIAYLLSAMKTDPAYTGTSAGKGFSVTRWRPGIDQTTDADVVNYQVLGYPGSGHRYADFYGATAGNSLDNKYWILTTASEDDTNGRYCFVYDSAEIRAAGPSGSLDVDPVAGPFILNGPSEERAHVLQAVCADDKYIYTLRGHIAAFSTHRIEVYDYQGNHIRNLDFDSVRTPYGRDLLLDHPTLGIPFALEPEGICLNGDEVEVLMTDVWRTGPDIVSWQGENWAALQDNNIGRFPSIQYYWVKTKKAATAGAWNATTTYNATLSGGYTKRDKVIYGLKRATGAGNEQPVSSGIVYQTSAATAKTGESAVDFSWVFGRNFTAAQYSQAQRKYYTGYVFTGETLRLHDTTDGSDNTKYGRLSVNFAFGREYMAMQAAAFANSGSVMVFGENDSQYRGGVRICGKGNEGVFVDRDGITKVNYLVQPKGSVDASMWNWKRSNNAKAAAALAKVLDGTGRMTVAEIGDSTGYGQTTAVAGAKATSRPSQLAAMLAAAGIPTNVQSVFGTANWNTEADIMAADPTISMGTGWVIGSSFTAGGNTFQCANPNTGIFAWTPVGTVDRFRLRYPTTSAAGVLEYSLDGTNWTAINQNAANSLQTVTINATRGANTLRLRRASGGTVYLCTLEAWDSLTPAVDILNMGWRGASSYNWSLTTQPWYAPGVLANVAADLTIINLTINSTDLADTGSDNASNFEANYKDRMQALIDIGKATGDVWLMVGNMADPSLRSNANQQVVRRLVYELATTNDLFVADLITRFGRWSEANADGLMADWAHLTPKGYTLAAQVEFAAFRRLA